MLQLNIDKVSIVTNWQMMFSCLTLSNGIYESVPTRATSSITRRSFRS